MSRLFALLVVTAAGSWLLPACGRTSKDGGEGSSGSAGQGRAGSTSTGGSGGSAGGACEVGGEIYGNGDSFPAGDDCNVCYCYDGEVSCTTLGCPEPGCYRGDTFYALGSMTYDECGGYCRCESDYGWVCTANICPTCEQLSDTYAAAVEEAQTCDPSLSGQCSKVIFAGLQCGCATFINPAHDGAVVTVETTQAEYLRRPCGDDVACEACASPLSSYCSPEGRCVNVYDYAAGASCQVDGQTFPSGSSDVPDPLSCNLCTCTDGQLACAGADCSEPCPEGTVYGTQCVQCGGEGCEVVEHVCLPVCAEGCGEGVCLEGVCKSICG